MKSIRPRDSRNSRFFTAALGGLFALAMQPVIQKPAHAIAGLVTANPPLVVAGAVIAGAALIPPAVGLSGWIASESCNSRWQNDCQDAVGAFLFGSLATIYVSPFLMLAGLIVLPDQSGGSLSLLPIDPAAEPKVLSDTQLTHEQIDTYNQNLPELNALVQDTSLYLAKEMGSSAPGKSAPNAQQLSNLAATYLTQHQSGIDPEAFEAFLAIAKAIR